MKRIRIKTRCRTCVRRASYRKDRLCGACYQQRYRGGFIGHACDGCGTTDTRVVGTGKLRGEDERRPLCANCRYLARACPTIADLHASVGKGAETITALGIAAPA